MSQAYNKINLRFKLVGKLAVWKEDAAIFDGSTGEVLKALVYVSYKVLLE